jgi:hypothetical protein
MVTKEDEESSQVDEDEYLFLHFDINETIWIGDEAGGDSFDQCLHKILAKSAYVRYTLDDADEERPLTQEQRKRAAKVVPTHWWDGTPIDQPNGPPLWTHWEWPPNALPYYRTSYKQRAVTFVEHHGRIYRPIYDSMRKLFQNKKHGIPSQMLPSFVVTLRELSRWVQSNPSLHITVILRTFGTDLSRITESLYALVEQEGHADWICPPQNMAQGRWKRCTERTGQQYEYRLIQPSYCTDEAETLVSVGDTAVLEWIYTLRSLDRKGGLVLAAIQDDYDHWSSHSCIPQAGKPIWKTRNTKHHHILFDDNMYVLKCVKYRSDHLLVSIIIAFSVPVTLPVTIWNTTVSLASVKKSHPTPFRRSRDGKRYNSKEFI